MRELLAFTDLTDPIKWAIKFRTIYYLANCLMQEGQYVEGPVCVSKLFETLQLVCESNGCKITTLT